MKSAIKAAANIEHADEAGATATFIFDTEFVGFDGHFPGRPVLPGVCLVLSTMVLAEAASKRTLRLREIRTAKFSAAVLPDQKINAECNVSGDVASAVFQVDGIVVSKIKVAFNDA